LFPSDDQYLTIRKPSETVIRVKASRFLGLAVPVAGIDGFRVKLQERSKLYRDATHHCWAYRIICDDKVVVGSNDAGEPSGTAGKPILSVIEGRGLLNTGVIVTRYFGGTKLGVGRLARAYAECANHTLDMAAVVKEVLRTQITVCFPYDNTNEVMRTIDRFGGKVVESRYGKSAQVTITVPRSLMSQLQEKLRDACRGDIDFIR
jgi:uncharacterized YigZ family protein